LLSDRPEVALRRVIGLKKDEYLLDRKNVSRAEVFNILESAGFSRSNPYYIVEQGKVMTLCNMSDAQRIELLKEVAGTRVYDERREESRKIMEETRLKREKITEMVQYIEDRISELEGEREELREFQALDKDRRALEYVITIQELEETKKQLAMLEENRMVEHGKGTDLFRESADIKAKIEADENEQLRLEAELIRLRASHSEADGEKRVAQGELVTLEADLRDAEYAQTTNEALLSRARNELRRVRVEIKTRGDELSPLLEQLEVAKAEHENENKLLISRRQELLSLRVKAGRHSQFSSRSERDRFLNQEIQKSQTTIASANQHIEQANQVLASLNTDIEQCETISSSLASELQSRKISLTEASEKRAKLVEQRNGLYTRRQELWTLESEKGREIASIHDEANRIERGLRSVLGNHTTVALSAIKDIAFERNLISAGKYHGPLLELIEVDSKFVTAADVAGGTALAHVVVEDDETATILIRDLQRRKAGRLTFIPLNRVGRSRAEEPAVTSQDALPLLKQIACDPKIRPAVQEVFGRWMVARSVEVAAKLAKSLDVNCVTLDGDQVNRRGAMQGGFIDSRKSRLAAMHTLKKTRGTLQSLQNEGHSLKAEVRQVEDEISQLMGELERVEKDMKNERDQINRCEQEIRSRKLQAAQMRKSADQRRDIISTLEKTLEESREALASLENEIMTDMQPGLSSEEQVRIELLTNEVDGIQKSVHDKKSIRVDLEMKVNVLKAELESNLEKRALELEEQIQALERPSGTDEEFATAGKSSMEDSAEATRNKIAMIKSTLSQLDRKMSECKNSIKNLIQSIEDNKTKIEKIEATLSQEQTRLDTIFSKRSDLSQKKVDLERRIREVGSLPSDLKDYESLKIPSLKKRLSKVNEAMKKYSHVNKKALDQYAGFTTQRDALDERGKELDNGQSSIESLIKSLDDRKDEDIMRTFRGVSKSFQEVFAELVPGGKAQLVMLYANREEPSPPDRRESYAGVAMKVRTRHHLHPIDS